VQLPPEHLVDFDTEALWKAQWLDKQTEVEALLHQARWELSSSIEGERYWQNHQLAHGRRGFLQAEAQGRAAAQPENPDFQYLQARLLSDPIALQIQFEVLAMRWPHHAWIRLGAAGSNQNIGNWTRARTHLRSAPDWPDAREFRHLLEAKQAQAEGAKQAWTLLADDALRDGSPAALDEFRRLATRARDLNQVRRAEAEKALRVAAVDTLSEKERLLILLERGLAELACEPKVKIGQLTAQLDGWSAHLNLPPFWVEAPRYQLPFAVGQLIAPESDQGPLTTFLAKNDLFVMLGSSIATSANLLVLQGVQRHKIAWPGLDKPLEIAVCDSGQGTGNAWVSGGAIFRGFYARRDLSDRLAISLQRSASRLKPETLAEFDQIVAPVADFGPPGSLPEDQDLALRLRAGLLQKQSTRASQWEWQALLLHEAGHLPDVLPWTQGKAPVAQAIWWAFRSWMQDGMVLGEWEYRAQLRALASGETVVWSLANVVQTAQRPDFPYYQPYRRLLRDLVHQARKLELPELPNWHRLSPVQITQLARALCQQAEIELLPASVISELLLQLDIEE
jgi:hypothetical protein